ADRGYFFTVGQGFVTHRDESMRDRIVNAVKEIPDDLVLVEVDTVPREGWRAPSSMLVGLLERLAEFRRVSAEDLEHTVQKNALRLMRGVEQLNPYLKLLQ
ncbi:MAG: TatD family hydrolase, partial [Candidatus Thorarchaeota archaeon]